MTLMTRRTALLTGAASLFAPALARAGTQDIPMAEQPAIIAPAERHNISSFREIDWRAHFDTLDRVTLIADTRSKALHYWAAGGTDYRLYPTSVPKSPELTKTGYTEIVRKRENPSWTPTASMIEADPSLHPMEPGPDNPLGTRAMYLSWPAYIIHGTHDTRKIGRKSSSGCIGLFNAQVEELYPLCPVGTQVLIL
ncbi:lipoprotein-anchoring transpeptidase ErfK/SrfK [Rhodobacter aestuarii]|uniref:Lipoprotein-anchoring transpeptidase ErfK/SrfK n=1 Tax=Rhodobacter aestuarii TaxID=453582 RepID=A0A1N7NX20_9RHOB|nr:MULTISPECIES: L,D-transpeptidase [Rhodobacter]PTV94495.1 lipoprotein-anchoring transpeptidase ErfK/SrfK [Rhodobacter aestuarii]SIT02838.1 Lipoprotein-anchoring transpeptidase ErfK/SrfK [Rhodobacter aestuarii]SOC12206.1 lipoprotein-anchoring transpeptidase ErfK/SrfK [Rhodobacter sp. JA431]